VAANANPKDIAGEELLPFRWVTRAKLIYPTKTVCIANYRQCNIQWAIADACRSAEQRQASLSSPTGSQITRRARP
jgi:hypothetical protein